MKQSLVKLVDVILRKMQDNPNTQFTEGGLRTWLMNEGYNKRDIEAAIRLVRPQFLAGPGTNPPPAGTVRLLSDQEALKLSPEAHRALIRLDLYGLISPEEREAILDRLGQIEGEVGLEELDYLLSWVVGFGRDVETQQTIYSVLDGEGTTLH